MNDDQLLRYSRHILLGEVGIAGQERILAARALVVGAGGLGSPVALFLATAGVGRITLCDGDTVDLTNLQRQIAHRMATVGMNKAESARKAAAELNPGVQVDVVPERVEGERLVALVAGHDIVLDCSDNFATRHAVNRACVRARVPLVSGAAVRFDGQVAVFDPRRPDGACYRCLFPEEGESEDVRCAVMGVFAPLVGIVGSLQAAEALKLIVQAGEPLSNRLLLFDALAAEWRSVRLARDPACPVCGPRTATPN